MKGRTMWSLILFIAILETIGMSIIEDSANKKNNYFIVGLIFYMIVGIVLYHVLKVGDLAITNALWNATTVILVSLVGIFYFKEKFSKYQYIGLIFAILAIIFMEMDTLLKLFN